MQVETLLRDIENKDLVLPEFQRDFVWNEEDVKIFIQSLYKGYPTGSLLIWKTLKPPKIRGEQKKSDSVYTRVLLDGQQRLTSLFILIKNKSPPYYENMENKFNLFFNVQTEEFRYYQKTLMRGKKEWISLIDFFQQESATSFIKNSSDREYYFNYLDQLDKLEKIRKYDYFVDEEKLTNIYDLKEIVRIFNLVNKQGRTLKEEELALAHVCVFWPEIKELFRKEIKLLDGKDFLFDFNFFIQCLNCVVTGHAKFENFYNKSEEEIKEGWERTRKSIEYLINILIDKGYINSNETYELKSEALLVPIITYLAKNGNEFKSEESLNKFLYWLYVAMIWGRYTRRGKSSPLEQDVVTVTRENNADSLIKNLKREIRDFEVKESDIEKVPVTSPFFSMTFIVAKSKGARDWFNGNKLHYNLIGDAYYLNKHHIFPRSLLKKLGYYRDIEKKKMVNELANRAFLTERANKQIRNTEPVVYLKDVVNRFPNSLSQQFVPENKELWKLDNFEDFLRQRRKKIALEINKFLNSLIEGEKTTLDIKDLIKQEESYNLEFKSSYIWDYKENRINKDLKYLVLKTIVGFLNTNGGILIIGVDDNHNIIGLEKDYNASWKGNKDGFLLDLRGFIESNIGGVNNFNKYINIDFEKIEDKEVCVIQVEVSLDPIFVKKDGRKVLYVRLTNKTEPLDDPEEINKYIEDNWE